jgi:uncharacterized protein YndB with AHSA1/START domain
MTQPEGQATTEKGTFYRETSVGVTIHASAQIVWRLLTEADDFARWNSTVVSVKGEIKPGGGVELVSKLDPKRVFKLKVKEFVPEQRLVWGDSKGSRSYALSDGGDGAVRFAMRERIGGLMFPLYAKYIPSFDASFDDFAADLKREAEAQRARAARAT